MSKTEALGKLVSEISTALESFSTDESDVLNRLTELAMSDPALFFTAGIRVIGSSKPSEQLRYLGLTMARDKRFPSWLLDPAMCTLQEALAAARTADDAGVQLQATFEIALNKALQGHASPQKTERISRILEILGATGDPSCWNAFQIELMAYPDKIVRSKAALLIGRSTRNVAWIARRLLDRDPRVQANAVEALWRLGPEETTPHFLSALRSTNNRVAANAALGLYLNGDASAMGTLLEMLRHEDPLFQRSALWAIGATQDVRFLPVLEDLYKQATGKLRLAVVGAMSRIRRNKLNQGASTLHIHMSQAAIQPDGLRSLAFALSSHPPRDLRGIKPTEFAVWENGTPIRDYNVLPVNAPAVLMTGFVAPWYASVDAPYEKAMLEAFRQCLSMKRPDDLWRIDRYSIEMNPENDEKSPRDSVFPYDDALMTQEVKASFGCISKTELLQKVLAAPVPANRVAKDLVAAFERQCDAFAKRGGKRHVFLFLHDMSGFDLKQDAAIEHLRAVAQDPGTVLHGICPDVAGQWTLVRELCLSNKEGSFTETNLEGIVEGLVDAYANLFSRFEINYSLPEISETASVELKISSSLGKAETSLQLAAPAMVTDPASVPAAAEETPA